MTTITTEPPRTDDRPDPAPRRPRRKKANPLLARGEPLLWLTGGGLWLSVLMIIGLLGLVLYNGFTTFWPQEVVRVQMVDDPALGAASGAVYMGEYTRDEEFTVTGRQYKEFGPVNRDRLRGRIPGGEHVAEADRERFDAAVDDNLLIPAHRRLMRTGNFELTNTHFHWIEDYAVADSGTPEWAVLVERMTWGRFYGTPQKLVVHHPRRPGELESALLAARSWIGIAGLDASAEPVAAALKTINERLASVQKASVAEFLGDFPADMAGQLQAHPAVGPGMPLGQVASSGKNIVEVRQVWAGPEAAWGAFEQLHAETVQRRERRVDIDKHELGEVDQALNEARLAVREVELTLGVDLLGHANAMRELQDTALALQSEIEAMTPLLKRLKAELGHGGAAAPVIEEAALAVEAQIREQIEAQRRQIEALRAKLPSGLAPVRQKRVDDIVGKYLEVSTVVWHDRGRLNLQMRELDAQNERFQFHFETSQGQEKVLPLSEIVRAYPANRVAGDFWAKAGIYASRWGEFLTERPREANSEGGVMPAIFGTVVMTLLMSVAVVPFGVLAALYLREYARPGPIVSAVRVAINNLAGVPSIVFGVFGLGFFCKGIGSFIDGGPVNAGLTPMDSKRWFIGIVLLLVIVAIAVVLGRMRPARASAATTGQRWLMRVTFVLWLIVAATGVWLIATTPYFNGFYRARLPNPMFGTGGLIWASLTLALLTLPVVIVSTEEALAAVPNSMREGSYGCGASKWQTIKRIVLPRAMPGIMTGMILAMARGAGEVAPLMLVGAVKLSPELPIAAEPPFGVNRSFMHLGFHIFDLGFQSQNSEAAKPMVFTTTLLLILIIASLNLSAIWLRARLRRKFVGNKF